MLSGSFSDVASECMFEVCRHFLVGWVLCTLTSMSRCGLQVMRAGRVRKTMSERARLWQQSNKSRLAGWKAICPTMTCTPSAAMMRIGLPLDFWMVYGGKRTYAHRCRLASRWPSKTGSRRATTEGFNSQRRQRRQVWVARVTHAAMLH